MQNRLAATAALLVTMTVQSGKQDKPAQGVRVAGTWRVDYTLPESPPAALRFEVKESGEGSFVPLDAIRSSLAAPVPGNATLTRTSTGISFSGDLNLPLGNVGIETMRLKFEGTVVSPTAMTGTVTRVDTERIVGQDEQRKGKFKATRIDEVKRVSEH